MGQHQGQGTAKNHAWQERWFFDVGSATSRIRCNDLEIIEPTKVPIMKARFCEPAETVQWLRQVASLPKHSTWQNWLPVWQTARVAVPSDAFPSDKEIVKKLYHQAGWPVVDIVTKAEAYAALVSTFEMLQPTSQSGIMVDIGAETTELVYLDHGQIQSATTWYQGGAILTQMIRRMVSRDHGAEIDGLTAERIKQTLVGLWSTQHAGKQQHKQISVKGIALTTGDAVDVVVTARQLFETYRKWYQEFLEKMHQTLLATSLQTSHELTSLPLWLTGGGSQLPGLVANVEVDLGLPIIQIKQPHLTVLKGLTLL